MICSGAKNSTYCGRRIYFILFSVLLASTTTLRAGLIVDDSTGPLNVILPSGPMRASDVRTQLANGAIDWSDVTWIREAWPGPIVV